MLKIESLGVRKKTNLQSLSCGLYGEWSLPEIDYSLNMQRCK